MTSLILCLLPTFVIMTNRSYHVTSTSSWLSVFTASRYAMIVGAMSPKLAHWLPNPEPSKSQICIFSIDQCALLFYSLSKWASHAPDWGYWWRPSLNLRLVWSRHLTQRRLRRVLLNYMLVWRSQLGRRLVWKSLVNHEVRLWVCTKPEHNSLWFCYKASRFIDRTSIVIGQENKSMFFNKLSA